MDSAQQMELYFTSEDAKRAFLSIMAGAKRVLARTLLVTTMQVSMTMVHVALLLLCSGHDIECVCVLCCAAESALRQSEQYRAAQNSCSLRQLPKSNKKTLNQTAE